MNDLAEQSEDLLEVENTGDQSEDQVEELEASDDIEEQEENTETQEDSEQKQSRSQNAKQRLRRKLREEQERNTKIAEDLRLQQERFDALEKKLEGVINPPKPRPQRVDFDTEEDYEDALFDWRAPKSVVEAQKEVRPAQEPRNNVPKEVHDNWLDQIEDAKDKYTDFNDALTSIPYDCMTEAMTLAIMESNKAGEIAYFLGKNHTEAERIAKLGITAQVKEIDKLATKFKTSTSSAPDPISPTKGKDSGVKDISKMSTDEYRKYRLEQMAARR